MRDETTGEQDAAETDRAADDQVTAGTGPVDPAVAIWREAAVPVASPAVDSATDQDPEKQDLDPESALKSESESEPEFEPGSADPAELSADLTELSADLTELSADPAELLPESEVFIEIPADRLYVVLARSAAVHIGAVLHLGITDVTDLRLAVDEACALFLLHPGFPDGAAVGLACRFAAYPEELRVTVRAPVPPGFAPDTDGIGWIMLGALVDDLAWVRQDGFGTVTLTKRFTPPRPH